NPRALRSNRAFDNLHDDLRAGRVELRDILLGNLGFLRGALALRRFEEIDPLVELLGNDVPIVQERVLLKPDIDERGLKPGLQIFNSALEHAGDDSCLSRSLDAELF